MPLYLEYTCKWLEIKEGWLIFKENLNTQAVSFASNLSELLNVKTKKTKKIHTYILLAINPSPPPLKKQQKNPKRIFIKEQIKRLHCIHIT